MKSYLECVPCFIRQTLDAVRRITDDAKVQEDVMRNILWVTSDMDLNDPPPIMGQYIHQIIRQKTGVADPYLEIKQQSNRAVLALYDGLKYRIEESSDPLETAARLAIAGNIIDMGANSHIDDSMIHDAVKRSFDDPLIWDRDGFVDALENAQSILYLADNAGEIVFDRLFIEQLPAEKITVAVRGFPILNDATMDDARDAGLSAFVNVIDNGSNAPGTILDDCNPSFVETFEKADVILSKGQGNYETLSESPKDIFFMLKAKCAVIARDIGCTVGDMIFQRSANKLVTMEDNKVYERR